jgi:hypothetical protein
MKKQLLWNNLKAVMLLLFGGLLFTNCENDAVNLDPKSELASSNVGISARIQSPLISTGFQGQIWEDLANHAIGSIILKPVKITFTDINSNVSTVVFSSLGTYKIFLAEGKYFVDTQILGYENFRDTNGPGYFVVTGTGGIQTGNLALKKITYGFQGGIWEDDPFGPLITQNVRITFTEHITGFRSSVYSKDGYYRIYLPMGKYFVDTQIAGYKDYNSSPGYFVVTGTDGLQTGNFFLKKIL